MELILASASPRRRTLLKQIGLTVRVIPSKVHEPDFSGGDMIEYARKLAGMKALDVAEDHPLDLVLGADTIVVVDDKVLGKPADADEALVMLRLLSNRWHEVITAYSLLQPELDINLHRSVSTRVHFRQLTEHEMLGYIETGAPFDKAGAYGIQDYSAIFVDEIQGCFYNVVGFPLSDFYTQLTTVLEQHRIHLLTTSI